MRATGWGSGDGAGVRPRPSPRTGLQRRFPAADAKEQVLANLANFAYDPSNYPYLRQLQVLDLFLDSLSEENETLVEFAIGKDGTASRMPDGLRGDERVGSEWLGKRPQAAPPLQWQPSGFTHDRSRPAWVRSGTQPRSLCMPACLPTCLEMRS